MPYVKKSVYDELLRYYRIYHVLVSEFKRHDEFVKKYQDSFASRNRNSNFQELKQKRDLLEENKKSYFEELSILRYFLNKAVIIQ